MAQSSRERVTRCLTFANPDRVPREMWLVPWAEQRFPEQIERILRRYPSDFDDAPDICRPSPRARGDIFKPGGSVDAWGCRFTNIQAGVEGEVRDPILTDACEWQTVHPPYETLPEDSSAARDIVNRHCAGTSGYVRAACTVNPWERWQALRGAETAMTDVMDWDANRAALLRLIHDFFTTELELWVSTDVDAVSLQDDWGSQGQLLVPPRLWRELFKPLYRDYCDLAHSHGKAVFFHSDGNITEIYEDLIEVGVDALNSQLFCMDLADLSQRAKGRITFWGEIDRQHVLPSSDPQDGRDAVRHVANYLYDGSGGIIAQFELGPGANPAVAEAIFDEWQAVDAVQSWPQAVQRLRDDQTSSAGDARAARPGQCRGRETKVMSLKRLADRVIEGDTSGAVSLAQFAIAEGIDPRLIIDDGLIAGMAVVGIRFRDGELYVPEVLVAARAMNECLAFLEPLLADDEIASRGTVVIATVKDDIHEIGKNLVALMLKGNGFEVIDLGVDANPATVVEAAQAHQADVVALSALLTTTMPRMKEAIDAFVTAGLRKRVKILVGGAPVTERFADDIGADGYAADAARAVEITELLLQTATE